MNHLTINHLNRRAALHDTESITHVSCKDIRDLLEERNLLIATLEACLPMVWYYDEHEGCEATLNRTLDALARTSR